MNSSIAPRAPSPIVSVRPLVLPTPGRLEDLQLRLTAPVAGDGLPIVLLSHGHGPSNHLSSLDGYAPVAQYLAAHGFAVVQPTHLDSKTLPYRESDHPDAPLFWRSRAEDMTHILDHLDAIEDAFPTITGRLDRQRVAVLGHSMGGHTASVLLGARHRDPSGAILDVADPRIVAGALLAAPGRGEALSPFAATRYPFFATIDLTTMTKPALVIAGEKDGSAHLTTAGAAWHMDPFVLPPGPKSLVTLVDAEHGLGGIAGFDVAETTDESPARVTVVLRLVAAYLRSALDPDDGSWERTTSELADSKLIGRIASK